ncbi:MAG: Tol-Pal system beta propeller repeat protein TolB [Gammaproteobacteria bacterium]|nr:Tol-Pal system beta propeller repeat protein TolB [Gammaproteobacteria bacterium]
MKTIQQRAGLMFVLVAVLTGIRPASAQLEIDITQGVAAGIPIAVVPFEYRGSEPPPHEVSDVVESDLKRSGRFEAIAHENFLSRPHDHDDVVFKDWRLIKAEALVVGRVIRMETDLYRVEFRLFDVFKERQLGGFRYEVTGSELRKIAHQIADFVYEALIGEPGAFDTRIAYVTLQVEDGERTYLLRVADSDGYGPRTILKSKEPILSPAWSPDGEKLGYVSFEEGRSMVYVQRLQDASRQQVAAFKGINSAPAWSPDGRTLAFTSSRDGNPEIYLLEVASGSVTRLTRHHGIDTEAAWSPDGRHLVFTSDRSGRPQIYRIRRDGTGVERLTFEGRYNARASYDPNGERLTLVTNQGSGFRIGVYYLESQGLQVLTDETSLDESPTFAPNGAMILYATQKDGRGVLAAVSSDGRVKQTLRFQKGDVREPAWSPYNQKL